MNDAEQNMTASRPRAAFAWAGRLAARLGLGLLVLVACYVGGGRLLAPLAASQKDAVEELLAARLGTPVDIASLELHWQGFSPLVSLRGLRIHYPPVSPSAAQAFHEVNGLDILLDVPTSLLRRQWVTGRVDVLAPVLELVEGDPGRWSLAGLDAGGAVWRERVIDLLLNTAYLRLRDASLVLRPAGGDALTLRRGSLELRNRDALHSVRLQASLREGREPLRLMVDLEGDPRADFRAMLYAELRLDQILMLAPALESPPPLESLDGRARLWAFADQDGLQELRGGVSALALRPRAVQDGDLPALRQGAATFHARRGDREDRWQLWLESPRFMLGSAFWRADELFLDLDLGWERPVFELQAPRLDLGLTSGLLLALDRLPAAGADALRDLAPRGTLRNVRLQADLANPEAFRLRGNLDRVSVQPWKSAPAVAGVRGYLEAGARGGFVELDARDFSLHLPLLFENAWHYRSANARVQWRMAPGQVQVSSGVIDARGAGIHGRVRFALDTRRNDAGRWGTDFDLQVGVLEADAGVKSLYLPALPALAGTFDWLDAAILDGRLRDSGLVLRGHFGADAPPGAISTRSFYHVEDLSIAYLEGWPRIDGVSGYVQVNDTEADIRALGGLTAGVRLDPATATLRRDPRGGSWLALRGSATAGTAQGLDFLRHSPLRAQIGGYLDDWRAEGGLRVDMDLRVPIGVAGAAPEVDVDVLSRASTLELPAQGFLFEDVNGLVNYSSARGLLAEGLQGRLFGFPVSAGIESFDRQPPGSVRRERGTRISGSGRVSVEALREWPAQSDFVRRLLGFAEGEIAYEADLDLFQNARQDGVQASLRLRSPLEGLGLDLPEPFRHDGRTLPFELSLDFLAEGSRLGVRYGGRFSGNVALLDGRPERGMLYFGPLNQEFSVRQSDRDQPGLLVAGELERFDLDEWRAVAEAFGAEGSARDAGVLRLVDLNLGRLDIFGQSLRQVNAQLRPEEEGWLLSLRNDVLAGDFQLPTGADRPYDVRLDYLRLPGREDGGEEDADPPETHEDALALVDPARLPAIDFETAELTVGERELGGWRFNLRPRHGGATVEELVVDMDHGRISDAAGDGGAVLEWDFDGSAHRSAFSGRFLAGDLASALAALGFDAHVESRSADFRGALAWPGSPAAFALSGSSGALSVDIRNGRFVNIDSGGSRLFGALSFDAIVRRLELDFSDLFGRGFAYDTIQGELDFDEGIVTTRDMVRIAGPSSKIAIGGRIDLMQQTIDADMLVTLPLSQNLTVVAGLLGAWPLAVSSYVAGKIFEEQMDEFTTLVYRLEGPWDRLDGNFEVPEAPAEPLAAPPQANAAD